MRRLALMAALAAAFAAPAAAQTCSEIRFAPGAYSGIVSASSRFDDYICYGLGVTPGQTIEIEILDGANTVFSVPGVNDAQDRMAFRATGGRYEIRVFQLFRSAEPEAFRMQVTIR